ncbi:MAG: M14 family zinc carboxypeptidase [Actinomycetota bacterium]
MSGFPMGRRRFLAAAAGAATLASVPLRARAGGTKPSGPASTQPEFLGEVPSPADVLGFALGVDREVTSAEADRYLRAVGLASPRVHVDQLGTSVRGRPIRFAIVGRPEHVTQEGLAAIRAAAATIRDPATPSEEVGALAETTPLILWVIANVHGSEESGADTSLQLLYELADRADEVVTTILDRAVVVLVPVQNPDGREADERRNAYGFDLNRDLFARTQPETDGRVELMRAYPPALLLDEHEFGYYRSFFPPNNDPVYAEVTRQVLGWINDVYGEAMSARFVADGEDFFHGGVYDFFAAEFNDTVAANGFQAAGMTLEVYNGAPLDRRFARHSALAWTCLWAAARRGPRVWREQHRAFVEAVEQGRRGRLEPNERTFHPELRSRTTVPREPVRHYFLLDEPAKRWELQRLVRRLQRMDVRVHRLVAPLDVPDFTPYHERERGRRLPAGTIWIPMAQPQKHWIQMLLHEHPYPPTNYTFGLAGWSNPLCMNLSGGRSSRAASRRRADGRSSEPPTPALPEAVPSIGLYQMSFGSYADESCGSTRWTFERLWGLTFHEVRNEDLAAGSLDGIDVLVAPGATSTALRKLGDAGGRTLVDWVERRRALRRPPRGRREARRGARHHDRRAARHPRVRSRHPAARRRRLRRRSPRASGDGSGCCSTRTTPW